MSKDNEETITITLKEYKELQERDSWLYCLEAAGVDNWSGFDLACEIRDGEYDE